jgi:hypothetical protein
MKPRTYVAEFKDDLGEPWQVLTIVYEDTIHQAVRRREWETWSVPLEAEPRP